MLIEIVELDNFCIPTDGIRMVIMQPHVDENLTDNEPFRWKDEKKYDQIENIKRTLMIAKSEENGIQQSHFTIFPEYSIPGLDGASIIQCSMEMADWPNNTIVIGGIDGLNKAQYGELTKEAIVSDSNKEDVVEENNWVNCCVTWIKKNNGVVVKYIQPKFSPAWLEKNTNFEDMFCGKSIYLFEAKFTDGLAFRFLSLICADWIGKISPDADDGVFLVLNKLNELWNSETDPKPIHQVFVIKHNLKPNHSLFLNNATKFFTDTNPTKIDRHNCLVFFANTAGGNKPGKHNDYGFTSIISHPASGYVIEGCPPTYAVFTNNRRNSENLDRCKEGLFRETGACIHSIKLYHPSCIGYDVSDRCLPIENAIVHSIDKDFNDPRVPGLPVPASIKWVNDELDEIRYPNTEDVIRNDVTIAYNSIISEMRLGSGEYLQRSLNIATNREDGPDAERKKNIVDIWSDEETESLKTIVNSLSVISCMYTLSIKNSPAHAILTTEDNSVFDIVIVSGQTNNLHKDNLAHIEKVFPNKHNLDQRKVIVVSRADTDHSSTISREKNIYDTDSIINCDYQTLFECLQSHNREELQGKISSLIGA
jgi:hypothetical protein